MKKTSVLLSWRLPLLVSLWAAPAGAHWGMPDEASSISVRSGHESDWIMGDASGALISRDQGSTWRWICPEGMGIAIWRPERYFWLSGGAILAATGSALVRSDDSGCTWTPHGYFKDTWVTSLAVHPVDERFLYVSTGRPSLSNGLYRSEDGGESWIQALAPTPGSQFSAIRVAVPEPLRIYASGQDAEGQFLSRSDDGGRVWSRLSQPLTGLKLPYDLVLLRVSDASPDVLWAKVSAQGRDWLLKSTDGGVTLTPVMDTYERISSVEASPDGRTVWVSTTTRLFRGQDDGSFTELAEPNGNACAMKRGGTLYGCGSGWTGGWALAKSADEGTTWEPMFKLGDVQGAHLCPASTPVQQRCPALWPQLAQLYGAGPDGGVSPPQDAGPSEQPVTPAAPDGCATAPGLVPGALLVLVAWGRRVRGARSRGS
ncbi:hypothetical protein [Corallococcus aberystwythensis]|nr:hypothetical protein [Corallococcus aberystwythensis]